MHCFCLYCINLTILTLGRIVSNSGNLNSSDINKKDQSKKKYIPKKLIIGSFQKPSKDNGIFINTYASINGRLELNTHFNTKVSDEITYVIQHKYFNITLLQQMYYTRKLLSCLRN